MQIMTKLFDLGHFVFAFKFFCLKICIAEICLPKENMLSCCIVKYVLFCQKKVPIPAADKVYEFGQIEFTKNWFLILAG